MGLIEMPARSIERPITETKFPHCPFVEPKKWCLQKYAGPGPYRATPAGKGPGHNDGTKRRDSWWFFMVSDSLGNNVAHTEKGAVLFPCFEAAQMVADYLNQRASVSNTQGATANG